MRATEKINIRLNTTPVKSDDFNTLVTGLERKDVAKIETPYGSFNVPIPSSSSIPKYQKVLNIAAAASIKTLVDTSLLPRSSKVDVSKTIAHVKDVCHKAVANHSKKVDRRDVMESILTVMLVEKFKEQQLDKICQAYSKPEMWVDPLTSGLWIVAPTSDHPACQAARVRKVVSTYELDDNQAQSLIALSFSKKHRETASAKLNLFSKLKGQ